MLGEKLFEKKHSRCRKSWSSFSHDALAYRCKQSCKYVQFTCKKGLKGENVYWYEKKSKSCVKLSCDIVLFSHVKNANYMRKCGIHVWTSKFHEISCARHWFHVWKFLSQMNVWYSHLNLTFIHKWKSQSLVSMSVSHVTLSFFTCENSQMDVKIISSHFKFTCEKGSFCIWYVPY